MRLFPRSLVVVLTTGLIVGCFASTSDQEPDQEPEGGRPLEDVSPEPPDDGFDATNGGKDATGVVLPDASVPDVAVPRDASVVPDATVPPDATTCTPTTCISQGKNCGSISDACGGTLYCGSCSAPKTCGGGGVSNVCGATCLTSCAAAGASCGSVSTNCGGFLDCGQCLSPSARFCVSGACRGAEVCDGLTTPLGGCLQVFGATKRCYDFADSYTVGPPTTTIQWCQNNAGTWLPGGCSHVGSSGGCKLVDWSGPGHCYQQIEWAYTQAAPVCPIYAGNIQSTFVPP